MSASMFDQPDVMKYYNERIALGRIGERGAHNLHQ